jgi:hypothetical protein
MRIVYRIRLEKLRSTLRIWDRLDTLGTGSQVWSLWMQAAFSDKAYKSSVPAKAPARGVLNLYLPI